MRAMVTGGAGFIGSHVVDLLLDEGHDVAVVDSFASGRRTNLNPGARLYEVDIRSPSLPTVVQEQRPEVVFHLAAQPTVKASTDDPLHDADVNIVGLLNLLEGCTRAGVRKVVFASSGATYGNPRTLPFNEDSSQRPEAPYGISKLAGEHYLSYYALDRQLDCTPLRYANVYGPRQDPWGEAGVVAIFIRQLLAGQTPTIHWDGEQVRDYVYVEDVARATVLAASATGGRAYCIGTGQGTSVNQLYGLLCTVLGVDVEPARGARRPGDLRAAYFDLARARDELGWEPEVSLREGLLRTVESFRHDRADRHSPAATRS